MGNNVPEFRPNAQNSAQRAEPALLKSPMTPNELLAQANELQQNLESLLGEITKLIARSRQLTQNLNAPCQASDFGK